MSLDLVSIKKAMKILFSFILLLLLNTASAKDLIFLSNPKSQTKLEADILSLKGRIFRYADELTGYRGAVVFNDKVYPLKFDIHGDLNSHWRTKRRSFSVSLEKKHSLFGMRNFSLIRYEDKYGHYEIFGQYASKILGLLHRKIIPINLKINYDSAGKYIIYEKIIPDALEHNGLSGSYIVSQNNIWKSAISRRDSIIKVPYINRKVSDDESTLNPVLYKVRPKLNSSHIMKKWKKTLLNPSFTLIDEDSFYSFLAIVAMTGSMHSTLPDNLRWIYRPWSGKFSPIYYDTIPRRTKNIKEFKDEISRMNYFLKKILDDVSLSELSSNIKKNVKTLRTNDFDKWLEFPFHKQLEGVDAKIFQMNLKTIEKW